MTEATVSDEAPNDAAGDDLGRRANKATIAGLPLTRKSVALTAAGLAVAAVGVLVSVLVSDGGDVSQSSGTGPNVNGDNNNLILQGPNEFLERVPAGSSAERYREEARKYAEVAPRSEGPWAFVVVADPALGLQVRSSADASGKQIGSAGFGATTWVSCKRDSGFDAGESNGSVWYQTGWPNSEPTTKFFNSSPGDPQQGWVYNGLVVPAGHNGKVPDCA